MTLLILINLKLTVLLKYFIRMIPSIISVCTCAMKILRNIAFKMTMTMTKLAMMVMMMTTKLAMITMMTLYGLWCAPDSDYGFNSTK